MEFQVNCFAMLFLIYNFIKSIEFSKDNVWILNTDMIRILLFWDTQC
jgi:uncharacterized membrane protein YobD (UPF0266 family)